MKKGLLAKRALAFVLAFAILAGEPMVASAAETTSAKPQKTVGVEIKHGSNTNNFTAANGTKIPYRYVTKSSSVRVRGNHYDDGHGSLLRDPATGLYLNGGVYYESAGYNIASDTTSFSTPVTIINIPEGSSITDYRTENGYYSINGKDYASYSTRYADTYSYVCDSYLVEIADGDLTNTADPATGYYYYNGKYYRDASYVYSSNETRFTHPVDGISTELFPRDEDNFALCGGKRYGVSYIANGLRFVYPYDEIVFFDAAPEKNEYGYYEKDGVWYSTYVYRNGKHACYGALYPMAKNINSSYFCNSNKSLYYVGGKTFSAYSTVNRGKCTYYVGSDAVIFESGLKFKDHNEAEIGLNAAKEKYLRKADGTEATVGSYEYGEFGGKTYKTVNTSYSYINGEYVGFVYAKKSDEIVFTDTTSPSVSWTAVPVLNDKYTSEGSEVSVNYQLEINGKIVNDSTPLGSTSGFTYFINGDSYVYATSATTATLTSLDLNKSVSVRVRALFCTSFKSSYDTAYSHVESESKKVVAVGAWSDVKSYKHTNSILITPKGFSAALSGSGVDVKWTPNNKATMAYITVISSDEPIEGINATNFGTYVNKHAPGNYSTYTLSTSYMDGLYSFPRNSSAFTYKHNYFAMKYTNAVAGYEGSNEYTNVVYVPNVKADQLVGITGLKIEKTTSGTQSITWDVKNVNSKVVVYAYTGKSLPAYYDTYVRCYKTDSGLYLYNYLLGKDASNFRKTFYATADMSSGSINLGSFKNYKGDYLEPGTKYNFVAFSYDTTTYDEDKTPVVYNNREYIHYYSVGKKSAVVSATYNAVGAGATAFTTDNAVKLSFSTAYTGHVIYKKNAKGKFVKLATTTDLSYTDTKLTKGQTYTYRVYNYNYNENTKKKVVSQKYYTISATPGTVNNFEVLATQTATNKVKLTWTKIPTATSYEIYKSQEKGDTTTSNPSASLNDAYVLVKTIKNAKTVATTDTIEAGSDCYYKVVAKYAVANKQFEVSGSDYINMDLTAPERVKSSLSKGTAKFSWIANKYAKGYEVQYTIYDKFGNAVNKSVKKTKTTKNSVAIKGIPSGGYITVKVRAYDGKGHYSSFTSAKAMSYLATSKAISAKYVAKEKAIKVSWKAVSGAKYYRVFRSTTEAKYDQAIKQYIATGSDIYASAVDRSGLTYHQFNEVANSITKTSAYDRTILKPGVKYYYTVVAYGDKNTVLYSGRVTENSSRTYNSTVSVSPKPAAVVYAPYSLKIASITSTAGNSVTLKYNKVKDATSYNIYRSTKKNGGFELVGTSKTTSFKDAKMPKEGTYYYRVESVGTNALYADYSVKSAVKGIKYVKTPATPKIKSVVAAKVKGKAQITIKWSKVNDATGYSVYRSTSKNGKYTKIATIKKNSTVSYVDKDKKLKKKTTYYYKVVAYRTANKNTVVSGNSSIKSVKTK